MSIGFWSQLLANHRVRVVFVWIYIALVNYNKLFQDFGCYTYRLIFRFAHEFLCHSCYLCCVIFLLHVLLVF